MRYLVVGSGGPGFASADEAVHLLEEMVLPSFDLMVKMEEQKKIVAGGLPVGDRAFVLIVEAASNEELDQILRSIPMWGVLEWEVTPLQTIAGRAALERDMVNRLKKGR